MKHKWIHRSALLLAAVLACAMLGAWLVNGSYPAGEAARAALVSDEGITVTPQEGRVVFAPQMPERGFIFYPGGRVSHEAYAPLMRMLAEDGWLCVLLEMPFDLAVLNADAAKEISGLFPQIDRWTIGGHSLGGAMAASHAASHPEMYDALVLLAAYSTKDLNGSGLKVISLYGENDGVLQMEKYAQYRGHLPKNTIEMVIPGGNHALFGDYGQQKGDGAAAITMQEQGNIVVEMMRGI